MTATAESPRQVAAQTVDATILVVDDDPHLRVLLTMTLERERYRVICAKDGQEGLEMARQHLPRLVLLDGEMPVMHGFDVCRALKSDPATRRITVLMLSAKAREDDIARGLAAGADAYITKPFSPLALLARLRQEVDRVGG